MTDPDKVHIVCVFYHAAIRAASKAIPNHGNMVRPLVTRAGLAVDHMMPLPLTEMIGLPLVFKAARLNPAFHNLAQRYWCFDPTSSDHHDPNLTLARLSTVVDPLSPELGMPEYEANCEVMLARADGKDLHSAHVQSMDIFIEQRFARLFELAAKDDMEGMKAELEKVMVGLRKAYVISYRKLRNERLFEHNDPNWIDLFCPVKLETPICENCDAETSGDGSSALLLCGRCKKVSYCSRECQKEDWFRHRCICDRGQLKCGRVV